MKRKYSQAQNKATQRYIKNAYDEIKIRVPKGEKDKLKAFVEDCGYPSMNQFVVDAIEFYKKAVLRDMEKNKEADREIMKKREKDDCM